MTDREVILKWIKVLHLRTYLKLEAKNLHQTIPKPKLRKYLAEIIQHKTKKIHALSEIQEEDSEVDQSSGLSPMQFSRRA